MAIRSAASHEPDYESGGFRTLASRFWASAGVGPTRLREVFAGSP
jgi:hypothetical protein